MNKRRMGMIALVLIIFVAVVASIAYLSREKVLEKALGLQKKEAFNEDVIGNREVDQNQSGNSESDQNIIPTEEELKAQNQDSPAIPTEITANWIYYPDPSSNLGYTQNTPIDSSSIRSITTSGQGYKLEIADKVVRDIVYQAVAEQPQVKNYMDELTLKSHEGYLAISIDLSTAISRPTGINEMLLILLQNNAGELVLDRVVLNGYEYGLQPGGFFHAITSEIVTGINKSLNSLELTMDGNRYQVNKIQFREGYFETEIR